MIWIFKYLFTQKTLQADMEKNDDLNKENSEQRNVTKERGKWDNQLEFILSCLSFAVGLGNIWRFPYLCYKNGGGAFLIPYFVSLFCMGLPIFLFEMGGGQFCSQGPIRLWKLCPLFEGKTTKNCREPDSVHLSSLLYHVKRASL